MQRCCKINYFCINVAKIADRMKASLIIAFTLLISVVAQAQSEKDDHKHDEHDHFHTNEIGVSFAPVYFTSTKETNFGLHGHYIRRFGESRFGGGVGVEYIFNEEKHQTYSAVFQYSPTYNLHLVAAPGIAVESEVEEAGHVPGEMDEHDHHGVSFAMHLEAVYEFSLGPFDIGPSVEFAWDPHDIHVSAGVHIAVGF